MKLIRIATWSVVLVGHVLFAESNISVSKSSVRDSRNPLDQGNDGCPATVILALPFNDTGTTVGLANDALGACVGDAAPDVLFSYTPASSTSITVSLCGSNYDSGLIIRTDGACPGTTEVACNDDFCGTGSQVTNVPLNGGQTYWIIVDGWSSSAGNYVLSVTGEPVGSDCPATEISAIPYVNSGNTCSETNDFVNCVGATSRETVYTYSAATTQSLTASLCGSSYDTALEIREGGACPGQTPVGCNDDNGPACEGLASSIQFTAVAGSVYFFIVHGYGTSCGDYTFSLDLPPAPGRCCYLNGASCTDGISEAECISLYNGVYTANASCSDPCPCPPCSALVVRRTGVNPVQLYWIAPSNGYDRIYSTTERNNDGNPDGGLDPQWSLRDQILSAPGQNSWIEPDNSQRYRNYVVVHYCP